MDNKQKVRVQVVHEYLLFKEQDNPFIKLRSESGIILAPGIAESKETGEMEQLDQIIGFGLVVEVGDKCTYVKPGDGIFYDRRSMRALPVGDGKLWQYQERNLIGFVDGNDATLQEAFKAFYAEEEAIATKHRESFLANKAVADAAHEERQRKIQSGEIVEKPTGILIKTKY